MLPGRRRLRVTKWLLYSNHVMRGSIWSNINMFWNRRIHGWLCSHFVPKPSVCYIICSTIICLQWGLQLKTYNLVLQCMYVYCLLFYVFFMCIILRPLYCFCKCFTSFLFILHTPFLCELCACFFPFFQIEKKTGTIYVCYYMQTTHSATQNLCFCIIQ